MGLAVFTQNVKFIASLNMMCDVLPHMSALSKAMQTRDATYTMVRPLVCGTVALLNQLKEQLGTRYQQVSSDISSLVEKDFNIKQPSDEQLNNFTEQALAVHFNMDTVKTGMEWTQVKATVSASHSLQCMTADQTMEWVTTNLRESHPLIYSLASVGLLLPTSTAESKPHKELRDVVERKALLKEIQKLSSAEQTYGLESFHKICCFFASKFVHFFYPSMAGRLKLARLHFNENAGRPQKSTKAGELQWQVSTPKYKKGTVVAKQIKVSQTYNYVDRLFTEVLSRRDEFPSYRSSRADLQPVTAATPAPVCAQYRPIDKSAVVAAHRSRFSIMTEMSISYARRVHFL